MAQDVVNVSLPESSAIAKFEAPKRPEEDLSKAILNEALRCVTDPRAATITYPDKPIYTKADIQNASYENGTKVQFVIVDNSHGLNRDQTCIAILENRGGTPHSFGYQVARKLLNNDQESTREIFMVRFTQEGLDAALQKGIVQIFGLSENIEDASGRHGVRINALRRVPNLNHDKIPNIASRWKDGSGQLLDVETYSALGETFDITQADYADVLQALKAGKINDGQIDKVVAFEKMFGGAIREEVKLDSLSPSVPSSAISSPKK